MSRNLTFLIKEQHFKSWSFRRVCFDFQPDYKINFINEAKPFVLYALRNHDISNLEYIPKAASQAFSLRASLCSSASPKLLATRQSAERLHFNCHETNRAIKT